MREIKFRAWSIADRKYIYDDDFWLPYKIGSIDNCYPVRIINIGILYCKKLQPGIDYIIHTGSGTYYSEWEEDLISSKDIILEQYTGLKDKNGKEIYEGDNLLYAELSSLLKVEFYNGGFGYRYLGNFYNLTAFKCSFTEIIGNIHESK